MTKLANLIPKKFYEKIPRLKFLENYRKKNTFLQLITFRIFDSLREIFNDFDFEDLYSKKIFNKIKHPHDNIAAYDQSVYRESLLIRQDKISMAHGLESRVPYVDTKLLKFVNSISYNQRYRKNITKNTLKQISKNFFLKILYIERKMVLTYQFQTG